MPPRSWQFRVDDILDAIQQVQAYTAGMDFEAFASNTLVVDGVLYRIAVIGEAARAIPDDVKVRHEHIPWRAIQTMRNRLVHEYFGVRVDTVWQTVVTDLPSLILAMESLKLEGDG